MKTSQMLNAHHEMRLDRMNEDDDYVDDDGNGDRKGLKNTKIKHQNDSLENCDPTNILSQSPSDTCT